LIHVFRLHCHTTLPQHCSLSRLKGTNACHVLHFYHVRILAALWLRLDCHKPDAVRTNAAYIAPSANR
jgi:hypothetical protein